MPRWDRVVRKVPRPGKRMTTLARKARRQQMKSSFGEQMTALQSEVRMRDATIIYERTQRVAAQRGLVPYVRSLERLNGWLRAHRGRITKMQLVKVLKDLGLYDIKLGYD